jgi:carboxyl-terminal processing protease
MMKIRRNIATAVLALALWVPASGQGLNHDFSVSKNLEIFNTLYKNLDMTYVDTLNADSMICTAIDYMLATTDAFTEYFNETDLKDLKQQTTGKYAGIGALIRRSMKDRLVHIAEPYEGSPAAEAGLKAGDEILEVDGMNMEGQESDVVSSHLLGEANTPLEIKVQREGQSKPLTFKLTRRNIHIPAVPYYAMLNDSVGYLFLESVTDGCSKEMKRALVDLKTKGARSLVLDLRENGGGSLQEAIEIVNFFVDKGKHIVQMKGRIKSANADYKTLSEPMDTKIPVTVLVDENTASAAEIISGSLQDLDRAVVIGQRTFGKGLVQEQLQMPYGGVLKVTTSKYYIPSGRCIQAFAYKHMNEIGFDTRVPDSLTHVFKTAGGREVRDGGGIKPDIAVKPDTMGSNNIVAYMLVNDEPLHFACQYATHHKTIAPAGKFCITDADYADFSSMLKAHGFTYDLKSDTALQHFVALTKMEGYYDNAKTEIEALKKKLSHNLDQDLGRYKKYITDLLNNEIVRYYYFRRGAVEQQISNDDKDLKAALEVLADPGRYKKILGK